MKMSKQVSGTKNSIAAVRGSTSTPMFKVLPPVGSHGTLDANTSLPKCSVAKALKKTYRLMSHETAINTMARVWLNALLRLAKSQIRKNASRGGNGMGQTRV